MVKGWTPSWLPLVSQRELMDRMGAVAYLMTQLEDRVGAVPAGWSVVLA